MTLKVLSLNVWHDQSPWSERARLIRQWIERLESDLIGFQEVLVAEKAWKSRPENGFPPIIVGDFNAEPGSDEIRYMTGLHSLHGESVPFLDAWTPGRSREITRFPVRRDRASPGRIETPTLGSRTNLDGASTTSLQVCPVARDWGRSKVVASFATRKRAASGRPTISVSLRSCARIAANSLAA
jgi:hypothetical protein